MRKTKTVWVCGRCKSVFSSQPNGAVIPLGHCPYCYCKTKPKKVETETYKFRKSLSASIKREVKKQTEELRWQMKMLSLRVKR
jgi:hypothetical protein